LRTARSADLAAGAAAKSSPPPAAQPGAPAGAQAALPLPEQDEDHLKALVQRLDEALGEDGRLL
jgi:cell division protein ZapA